MPSTLHAYVARAGAGSERKKWGMGDIIDVL
jgi:hypothetical protein